MARPEEKPEALKGLLSGMLGGTPLAGLGITPKMLEKDIVIEMTEAQFRDVILEKADARAKASVNVEFHEGKMVLRIKLW